jgi:hypothetical protein
MKIMSQVGYDIFFAAPGKIDEIDCNVCGTKCVATRNAMGPTHWGSAVAHQDVLHDRFECPHTEEEWHGTALKLVEAIQGTPSKRLAELMRLDLEDILKDHV